MAGFDRFGFFFSSRRRHTRCLSDWSSDVCSSDLDKIIVHLTNVEQTPDATHGFAVPMKNVMVSLDPGETTTVEFTVDKPGSYSFYCTEIGRASCRERV